MSTSLGDATSGPTECARPVSRTGSPTSPAITWSTPPRDRRVEPRRRLGRMVKDQVIGKVRYDGLGFHDLRRANATGLVAKGGDVKTAQGLLGHSDSRLTLDHYAQVVTEQGEAAAKAMGRRFLRPPSRNGRAMEGP